MEKQEYWSWIDGEYTKSPQISALSSAALHGYGVFETLYFKDTLRLCSPHLERLASGAEFYGLEIPTFSENISEVIHSLVSKNNLTESRIRVSLLAKELSFSSARIPSSLLITSVPYHREEKPVSLKTYPIEHTFPALSSAKSTSYAGYILAKRNALLEGFDDALFLDSSNQAIECSSANIFLFKDDQWYTPNLDVHGLPGIQRQTVITAMEKLEIPLNISNISLEECSFGFVTNSLIGIQEIQRINSQEMQGAPSSYRTLKKAWSTAETKNQR